MDDSGAPNAFENDGYDEPGPESDEALTHALPAAGTTASDVDAVALVARSHASTSVKGDAPYNVHVATNHDGGVVAVVTTSGRARVYERRGTDGGLETATARDVEVGCVVNECEFGPREDPYSLVCACGDGTVRVYDARCGDSRAVASFRAPAGERDVCSATLGGGATGSMIAAAVGPHVVFFDRRRQGADASHADMFRDAHSEAVTRARFHPERRRELYTSSVDGLMCAFDCSRAPLNDEDALIAIMSADAAVNTIGFCRSGASGDERDAVWCATGSMIAAAVGPHVVFFDRRRQGADASHADMFRDAHSEAVTRARFHPERRRELYTSSVDGLMCAFDCSRAPLNDEDALIAIMSADAAVNTIGFCRSGASGDERDAVWCATGVEEAHVFVASSDRRRVGVHLAHLKNAREVARAATTNSPRASSTAPEFLAGVDYIVGVHDGVAPGELFLSAGTQAGVVGVFPLVQGPSHARGTADFITLAPPVAVLRHGHRDIVRCVAWDANARASEPSRVPLTCGEDSLVCAWTPGTNDDAAPPPPVDRTRPPGRRHSPY